MTDETPSSLDPLPHTLSGGGSDEPSQAQEHAGVAQPLTPMRTQTADDFLEEIALIGSDYPNFAELPLCMPCGHWRELSAHLQALAAGEASTGNARDGASQKDSPSPDLPPAAGADPVWPEWAASIRSNLRSFGVETDDEDDGCDLPEVLHEWMQGYEDEHDRWRDRTQAAERRAETSEARVTVLEKALERVRGILHAQCADDLGNVSRYSLELARDTAAIALSAAPPPADSGWRAIESAPRDGTPILARSINHDACEVVCWQDGVPSGSQAGRVAYDREEGWVNNGALKDRFYANPRWFTHWMPVPPADHDASEGRGGSSAGVESAARGLRYPALPSSSELSGKEE